jgi:molybdopterin-binding protein
VPITVTAAITKESVDNKEGDDVLAIVKSTEIMIAK